MAQVAATLFLFLILISVPVECHEAHNVYSAKAIHTPPMTTGCLDQLDALLRTLKQTGASQRELRRIARFYLQESVLHSVESSTNQKLFLSHVCSCYDFGPNVNRCAQLVEYAEHGREDGGLIPPDLPPQLAPHLNSDCSGELKQLTPRGVLAGVLRQLPTE